MQLGSVALREHEWNFSFVRGGVEYRVVAFDRALFPALLVSVPISGDYTVVAASGKCSRTLIAAEGTGLFHAGVGDGFFSNVTAEDCNLTAEDCNVTAEDCNVTAEDCNVTAQTEGGGGLAVGAVVAVVSLVAITLVMVVHWKWKTRSVDQLIPLAEGGRPELMEMDDGEQNDTAEGNGHEPRAAWLDRFWGE
jgi:hypothetical protein